MGSRIAGIGLALASAALLVGCSTGRLLYWSAALLVGCSTGRLRRRGPRHARVRA